MMAGNGFKRVLGRIPWTAEAYQAWRGDGKPPAGGFELDRLSKHLPSWIDAARVAKADAGSGTARRILLVGGLQWWVEHVVTMGLLLTAEGHQVDLAYVPYRRWVDPVHRFDLRRQQAYLRRALGPLKSLMGLTDLSAPPPGTSLSSPLEASIHRQADLDTQYTLQREAMDFETDQDARGLFRLRLERDRVAAAAIQSLLHRTAYDSIVIPNGSILEFGAAFRTARANGQTTVTYEFGEQRGRMWLAQNDEVMRLRTDALWSVHGSQALQSNELAALESLYQARRGGLAWAQFARQWQAGESQGARAARQKLRLPEDKKLVLLCTNVVGDSLALDRQIFTDGMADWLVKTAAHLAARNDCLLVVRVHPGELLGAGHPSREILHNSLPDLADKVLLVPPESDINTYDLIDLAHLGLVYTTTVGMEMAMAGVPVVVAGDTHYREKGFTEDPETLASYFETIDRLVNEPVDRRLSQTKIETAVRYAYRFFFEFPFAYPWHIVSLWDDLAAQPLEEIVQPENRRRYGETLSALSGVQVDWSARQPDPISEAA